MKLQIRGMLRSGLSGAPFWSHDAGGFMTMPTDDVAKRWMIGFGAFCPIWRPHGQNGGRHPLDRSAEVQAVYKTYIRLRYSLLPYNYSNAHLAYSTGMPMARAMFLEFPNEATAWTKDQQYMWGHEMLVAPNCVGTGGSGATMVPVWLPPGDWYNYWTEEKVAGNKDITASDPTGSQIPLFIRAGAVIPMYPVCLGTKFLHRDTLIVHAYTGANGTFALYEDDGVSVKYRKGESRQTQIIYCDAGKQVVIDAAQGAGFSGAPSARTYTIVFHGLSEAVNLTAAGGEINQPAWDAATKTLTVTTKQPVAVGSVFSVFNVNVDCGGISAIKRHVPGIADRTGSRMAASFRNGRIVVKYDLAGSNPVVFELMDSRGRIILGWVLNAGGSVELTSPDVAANGAVYVARIRDASGAMHTVRLVGTAR
jgi:alpha-D-xyloside xylohydrolase